MRPAEPLRAALTVLAGTLVARFIQTRDSLAELFFRPCGCCVHRILRGAEKRKCWGGAYRAGSATPTLFTPLQAIYTHRRPPRPYSAPCLRRRESSRELLRPWIEQNDRRIALTANGQGWSTVVELIEEYLVDQRYLLWLSMTI
jgi:hypothetical protein